MIAKRTSHLPADRLIRTITELSAEMIEFKSAQRTSGRSGVLGYLVQSGSTWDATGTVGFDTDGTLTRTSTYLMTFTGDGTQSPVMANLSFLFYANGTDLAHQITPVVNNWTDGGGGHTANISYGVQSQSSPTVYSQSVTLLTQKAITYYIKAYAVSSSGGTVTATRTS